VPLMPDGGRVVEITYARRALSKQLQLALGGQRPRDADTMENRRRRPGR
jgi:hypothetical protein